MAERIACGREGRAADEPETRVARWPELRVALLRDALHVAHGKQAAQAVFFVHYQQFVDAGVVGEKFVGPRDGVGGQFRLFDGVNLIARRERLGHFALGIARLHHMA